MEIKSIQIYVLVDSCGRYFSSRNGQVNENLNIFSHGFKNKNKALKVNESYDNKYQLVQLELSITKIIEY